MQSHEIFKKVVHNSRYKIDSAEIGGASGVREVFRGLEFLEND